jgi:SPP1 family predicted phage head-tail adaptor
VSILRITPVPDELGNHRGKETVLLHTRANVNPVGGREYTAASAVFSNEELEFELRYCRALEEVRPQTHSILFRGRRYDIKAMDNYQMANDAVKIRAVRHA